LVLQQDARKMASIETHALSVLRGLRALVGEVAFNVAVEAVRDDKDIATAPVVAEKKKRTRNITDEQRAVITRNMAALQAFTKTVRTELGEEVAYADAKKTAGERWKAMSKEEKEAWTVEHVDNAPPAAAPEPATEKTIVVSAPAEGEAKKGRGRPKKDAGAEVKVSKE
jgi:hypothetical protein